MRGWGFVPHFYMYDIKKTESGNFVYTENKPILFFNEKFIKIHKHNIVIYEYDKPMLADMIKLAYAVRNVYDKNNDEIKNRIVLVLGLKHSFVYHIPGLGKQDSMLKFSNEFNEVMK
ncbi:hypothetical protein MM5_159 [Morganella phage vB_Mm5]